MSGDGTAWERPKAVPNWNWNGNGLKAVSYWSRLFLMEALGTMPRSTSSWPLRRLPVLIHFSYRRSTSTLDAHDVRSLTSESTSTKPTNFSASSAKTGEVADVPGEGGSRLLVALGR